MYKQNNTRSLFLLAFAHFEYRLLRRIVRIESINMFFSSKVLAEDDSALWP